MPRAGLSYRGKALLRTTSQSRFARQGRVAAPSVCFAAARILLAAAPTAPPCFRHWRRSSPLPLVGEPLAKRRSFPPCQSLSLWERWHCEAMTERASPAGKSRGRSDGQALCQSDTIAVPVILGQQPSPLSLVASSSPAPPEGEPLACRSAFVWTSEAQYLGSSSAPLSGPATA